MLDNVNIAYFLIAVGYAVFIYIINPVIKSYVDEKEMAILFNLAYQFVLASEQLHPEPKSGAKKYEYVREKLLEYGVPYEEIEVLIESAVKKLNLIKKDLAGE